MPDPRVDVDQIRDFCSRIWSDELVGTIANYIRVPAKSPAFDPDWETNGYLHRVAEDAAGWLSGHGISAEVLTAPGRTPLLFFDAPGRGPRAEETVVFYGHLDKQPEFDGWSPGLGPWDPHFDGTRLYGRGGADDGYAVYAAAAAVAAVDDQGGDRPRCVAAIETAEESGSPDLGFWFDELRPRLGRVTELYCLDSGAGDYERLWLVTSLRGHCGGRLEVRVLDEGAHSGDAGGIVPSTFRIVRTLLDRLEDATTGAIRLPSANATIPELRREQAQQTADILGDTVWERYRWHGDGGDGSKAATPDRAEALLNRAWRPVLEVTGADGLPPTAGAGNVLRPVTAIKLSLRLPPTVAAEAVLTDLADVLTSDPPFGAEVGFTPDPVLVDGWNASDLPTGLAQSLDEASRACYDGKGVAAIGQGGTIPLMSLLASAFPEATMIAGGVQGPGTNAHGPNEALHVGYAEKLTAALALVLNRERRGG
ncbi:MAG: M20/M25/M40 family metallo-hydrolase [Propioniciclava sp.]